MNAEERDALLVGYLEDDLPPEERRRFEQELVADATFAAHVEEMRKLDESMFVVAERAWQATGLESRALEPRVSPSGSGIFRQPDIEPPAGPRLGLIERIRLFLLGPQLIPAALALALVAGLGGWIISGRNDRAMADSRPRNAATVYQSTAASLPEGAALETGQRYGTGAGETAVLSLAVEPNSLVFLKESTEVGFGTRELVRQEAGTAFYLLRPSGTSYRIELADGTAVSAGDASIEVSPERIAVRDGQVVVSAPWLSRPVTLVGGQALPLGGKATTPLTLPAEERRAIGAWAGKATAQAAAADGRSIAYPPLPPAVPGAGGRVATARDLVARVPGDATAILVAQLPEELASRAGALGPVVVASLPGSRVPLVVFESSRPADAVSLLLDVFGRRVFRRDEEIASPTPELAVVSLGTVAEPGEPAIPGQSAFLATHGSLVALSPYDPARPSWMTATLAMDPSYSVLGEPLGAQVVVEADSGAPLAFAVDASFVGLSSARAAGAAPGSAGMIHGRGHLRDGRLAVSGRLDHVSGGTGGGLLALEGDDSLLALAPENSELTVAVRLADVGRAFVAAEAVLLAAAYNGNTTEMVAQRERFEERLLGFRILNDLVPLLDGRIQFSLLPPGAEGGGNRFQVALGLKEPGRIAPLLRQRLIALDEDLNPLSASAFDAMRVTVALQALRVNQRLMAFIEDVRWQVVDDVLLVSDAGVGFDTQGAGSLLERPAVGSFVRGAGVGAPVMAYASAQGAAQVLARGDGDSGGVWGSHVVAAVWPVPDGEGALEFAASVPGTLEELDGVMQWMRLPASRDLNRRALVKVCEAQLDLINRAIVQFRSVHGRPPSSIDELRLSGLLRFLTRDPFSPRGAAPGYAVDMKAGTWRLWSVGPDRTDDGGTVIWDESRAITDRGDLVRTGP